MIKIGYRTITEEAFTKEALAAGVSKLWIDSCIEKGVFTSPNMQLKVCPTCEIIRKTTCCACGCGYCETCGYRWWCMPPPKEFSFLKESTFFQENSPAPNLGRLANQ